MSARQEPKTLVEAIDVVEQAYEFSLAYAGQGHRVEEPGGSMRSQLARAEAALRVIMAATPDSVPGAAVAGSPANAAFLELLRQDAGRAATAIGFVLAQGSIGSQMVENLNASPHIRTLLTDLFLFDEALKLSGL
jgi:hypothetical protein